MEADPVLLFDEDTDICAVSCGRSHTSFLTTGINDIAIHDIGIEVFR